MMLLGFTEYERPARSLADALAIPYDCVAVYRFPDGEHRVTLPARAFHHVILCRSLFDPNEKLIDLILAAEASREMGAKRVELVAPYLCYMRQDKAFHPGEAVSQKIIGSLLARYFDAIYTVDPHLHRTRSLGEAVPVKKPVAVSAAPAMVAYLRQQDAKDALLVGPDRESKPWVEAIAASSGLDYIVGEKTRHSDNRVHIRFPHAHYEGRWCILVDDVVSTGATMAFAAKALLEAGAAKITCLVTHALFVDGAERKMRRAGIREIVSTDSIPHPTNRIHLAHLLAGAIRN